MTEFFFFHNFHLIHVSTAAGQVWDSSAVNGQISATAGFSTNADVLGAESDSLTFTDGKKWSKKSKLSKYNMKYLLFFGSRLKKTICLI